MNLYVCKRICSGEIGVTRAQRKRATDLERRDANIAGALPKLDKEKTIENIRGYLADRLADREAKDRRRRRRAKNL